MYYFFILSFFNVHQNLLSNVTPLIFFKKFINPITMISDSHLHLYMTPPFLPICLLRQSLRCAVKWIVCCDTGTLGRGPSWLGTTITRLAVSPARSSTVTADPQNAGADYSNQGTPSPPHYISCTFNIIKDIFIVIHKFFFLFLYVSR